MHVGRYRVIGTLGSGGMSKVSLAQAPGGELVVLKRQHSHAEDPALYDEARLGIRLFHPHIVDHLDLFEHEGRPVLVVEYVSGATLADLKAVGPLPVPMIMKIGYQIADALHYIHTATEEDGTHLGMVHRDVTPANIIVGHDGNARLIDFGIARSRLRRVDKTDDGVLKGTLRYLAPELLNGEDAVATVQTDLWGLGMSLWEAALGRYAVDGDDPKIFASIITGRTLLLEPGEKIDPMVGSAVAQLLTTEPSCRPPSAHQSALTFSQYLGQFTDVDQLCQQTVLGAVGPPVDHTREATSIQDRHMLVNRAAATYGSPLGDWQVVEGSGVAQPLSYELSAERSAQGSALGSAVGVPLSDSDADRTEDISWAEPRDTDVHDADGVPAPVNLPSFPRGKASRSVEARHPVIEEDDETTDIATETIDMDALRASRQAAAPVATGARRVADLEKPRANPLDDSTLDVVGWENAED